MNKNTKKFVVTLLSVLMVLSFMPTIAFAGTITPDVYADHDYEEVEVLQEPNCKTGAIGLAKYKCKGNDTYDLECEAEYVDWKAPEHTYTTQMLTADKILDAALENYLATPGHYPVSVDQITEYYNHYKGRCRGIVSVCDNCGLLAVTLERRGYPGNRYYRLIDSLTGSYLDEWIAQHSTCTIPCAESYVCEFCGATLDGPNTPADDTKHSYEQVKRTENICGGLTILEQKCKDCGKEETTVTGGPAAHEGITEVAAPAPEKEKDFVKWNGKWYQPNYVVKEATCEAEGKSGLKCTKCGLILVGEDATAPDQLATIPKVDHKKVVNKIPATCFHEDIEQTVCSVCGEVFESVYTGKELDHDYKVETIFAPNCYAEGIILITCSKCGSFEVVDATTNIEDREKVHYFKGWKGTGELYDPASATPFAKCIVVPDWHQKDHDFGTYEKMSDPTCEVPELQARKCAVDGAWNVHDVKTVGKALGHDVKTTTVKATCGTPGYSYNTCDRCGKIQYGKTGDWYKMDPDETPADYGYDIVNPLVKAGAECQFEWVVTKEATVEAEGTMTEVCKICGAERASYPYSLTEEQKLTEAKKQAQPVLTAAGNLLEKKANYTDDTAKALQKAYDDLDKAMATGSAAQIASNTKALQDAIAALQEKAPSTFKVKAKTVKAKANKKTVIKAKKAFKVSGKAGKVTYKKKSGNKKITVSKAGKVTVKKGLKKGKTYKVKVLVTDAGSATKMGAKKTVTLKVKVK